MLALAKDMQMRVYIMDSLVARSGKTLTPDLIGDLTQELLGRMIEVHEPPMVEINDDSFSPRK